MGVMEKQTEEEKNRSKFLNNAEVRKEYQFIQRSTLTLSRVLATPTLSHHLTHPLVTGRCARAPADVPAGGVALQRGHLRSAARRDREAEGGGQAGDPSRQCARLPQPFRVRRCHHPRFVVCVPLFLNPPTLTHPPPLRVLAVAESPRQRTPGSTRMPSEAALLVARAQDDVAKNSPRGTPRGTPRGSDALDVHHRLHLRSRSGLWRAGLN